MSLYGIQVRLKLCIICVYVAVRPLYDSIVGLVLFGHCIIQRWKMPDKMPKTIAQLSRETALQGGLVMAKSERLTGRHNICGHYRSIFNHYDIIGHQSNQIR